MKLLPRILYREQSRRHLVFAFLGTLAGLVLLLSGIQFYLDFRSVLAENRDLLDPEYIVLNKKVNLGQTLRLSQSGFSPEEIADLKEQPFTEEVAPFLSNQFPVSGYTQNEAFPDFYTELFFEAIPDQFIDVKTEDWQWDPEEGVIPVIIPQDYLNLYNFGFAPSQGLPQIPKGVISMIDFKLRLQGKGRGNYNDYNGKIVGFSNRVHSILVPLDFLQWANAKYGYFDQSSPSQLILVSMDPTNPAIVQYLNEKGYDTIKEKLKSSRMNIILHFVMGFLLLIAAIIIGLAFLVFMLSLQLMISRSADKIVRLNKLGLQYKEISRPYILLLLVLMFGISTLSLLVTGLITGLLHRYAENWSLDISSSLQGVVYLVTLCLTILITAANILAIRISTKKLCN